jgi:FKBP-type peptidyl-prolyl cis-trans isomerase FkpA
MKKIKSALLLAVVLTASLGLMSCKKTKTTSDGIEYTYIKEGKINPKNGEYILYNLIVKTDKDSVFISTYDQEMPGYLQYNDSLPRESGMDEIFLGLKKADSIYIETTAQKVFRDNLPFFLKAEQTVKIQIGVIDVLDQAGVEAYFMALQDAQVKKMAEQSAKQLEVDVKIIEEYLVEKNISATKTESGLFYVIEREGTGPAIEPGDLAFVHYAGYLLDGTLFDTSIKEIAQANGAFNEQRDAVGGYAPFDVMVGQGRVIPGWDEGLALLKKGDKAKLIIPSSLAYGERAAGGAIGPNSILIFDVEITDVQK